MAEQRIVYTRPDGGLSVVIPAPGYSLEEVAAHADVAAAIKASTSGAVTVAADALPPDLLFRDAWKLDGDRVIECPVKSKSVAHAIRRQVRAARFAPHDEVIALRIPGKSSDVAEAARQQIRDSDAVVQSEIDACADVAALRAKVLTILTTP